MPGDPALPAAMGLTALCPRPRGRLDGGPPGGLFERVAAGSFHRVGHCSHRHELDGAAGLGDPRGFPRLGCWNS